MKELLPEIDRWRANGERVAIATVVATRRTAPRPVGSKLAVSESGELVGSVSAGCVEGDVYLAAQEVLAGGAPRLITYGISDEMALERRPVVRRRDRRLRRAARVSVYDELHRVVDEGGRAVVLTVLSGDDIGAKLLVRTDGTTVGDGPAELAALAPAALRRSGSHVIEHEGVSIFADVFAPPTRLFVYGAVDTAEALCRAVKLVGWTYVVADARARFATAERLPSADEILVAWPEEAFAQVRPDIGTAVVDPHPRRQVRPAGAAGGARERGVLHRRARLAAQPGAASRAGCSKRECPRRRSPGSPVRAASTSARPPRRRPLSRCSRRCSPTRVGRAGGSLRDSKQRIHAEPLSGKK